MMNWDYSEFDMILVSMVEVVKGAGTDVQG